MADFQLRVTADTQRAEKDLQRLDKTANTATKERKLNIDIGELNKSFRNVERNIKDAGNAVQTFYRVSKNIPGVGERVREFESLAKGTAELARNAPASAAALRENAKAGSILSTSFEAASAGAGRLINNLAKAGFALFAVKEAVGVVQSAFSGFFNETIGREIKLRETILKTQTTLASTNKVFRNGSEITDPYEKIVTLTGEVNKRIDSIRERSIALAGVTSNEVIEVFGIVASQVGQIGGGLKEAEDLAINFSAALGTFGIPLYQARQEIGSILRGQITEDSYLAKALGIRNEDIARARSQAGGVIKFLEERLAASVAGQRIAAQGFAGVVSNIRDLAELVGQRFGAGLLDPLLGGLTRVFDFLFKIREEVFAISSALGRGVGQLLSTNLTAIGGGSALFGQLGAGAEGFATALAEGVKRAFVSLQADAAQIIAPLRNLFEEVTKSLGAVAQGLGTLAQGFVSIQIENFKALVQIFSNLSEAVTIFASGLSKVLQAYGQLLQVPFVQYLSQISAQFQLLERLGVMSAVKLAFAAGGLIAAWQPIVAFFQGLAARIAALIGGMVAAVGMAVMRMGAIVAAFAGTLAATNPAVAALRDQLIGLSASLTAAGGSAEKAGAAITRFGGATVGASKAVATAIFGFIKFNLILLAVQVGVTLLIDLFGRWQKAQDKAVSDRRAEVALQRLNTTYKDIGDSADEATKRARDFEAALVDAKYNEAVERLENVRKKLAEIRDLTSGNSLDFGDYARRLAQLFNPANFDAILQQRRGELFSDAVYRVRQQQERQAVSEQARWAREVNKKSAEENIRIEADKRVNLEKEIADIRRQQDSQLFQQRQQLAQKEVEVFRAAGELRIFQMEQANKKLLEGEAGASAAALSSLNEYLSVRERGELEIESAKKQLVIEVANLERQIADYRLDNEKKIAEIRKRAGDYEQKVSDYRRQVAGQIAAGSGGGAATFGSTGNVSNAAGWVHGHFQTNTGTLNDLVADVIPVLKSLLDRGIPVELSNGTRVAAGKDDAYYSRMLRNAAQQHRHSGDGRSLDLFVPEGTSVPVPLANISGNTGRGGITGSLPGSGKSWVGHLAPGSKAGGAAALTPPKAPDFTSIGAPAVEKLASAIRSTASAMERLRALQSALTEAKTKAAFEEIAKAAFPRENIEQYNDSLLEARLNFEALASSQGVFDPDRTAAEVRYRKELLIMERERRQILERAAQAEGVTKAELRKLEDDINKRIEQRKRDLAAVRDLQIQINAVQKGADLVRQWQSEIQQLEENNQALRLRARLITEGVSSDVIDKELAKFRIQQDLNNATAVLNEALARQSELRDKLAQQIASAAPADKAELQKRLDEANAEIARLQELIRQLREKYEGRRSAEENRVPEPRQEDNIQDTIKKWKEDIKDMRAELVDFARTVQTELSSAMANSVFAILDGTGSIQEAFGNMFRSIYQSWVKMLTDMISKWIIIKLLGLFLPGGGAATGGGGGATVFAANGATFANGIATFARGGAFTNSIVSKPTLFRFAEGGTMHTGLMGEAGPEAILPLKKGPGGVLGVHASGGSGTTNIVVNVDASGSKVQGDDAKAEQLGRLVSSAVQSEIIKQKRPGGLLA